MPTMRVAVRTVTSLTWRFRNINVVIITISSSIIKMKKERKPTSSFVGTQYVGLTTFVGEFYTLNDKIQSSSINNNII